MTEEQNGRIMINLHGLRNELEAFREMLLANVIMIGEIPSPTFGEENRIAFLKQRFTECGLQSTSSDEVGNGMGILPGTEGKQTILLAAHADTPFGISQNHTCTIESGVIHGPGVADNSLGLAVLATLPTILDRLGLRFKSDLLLMGATRSLEQGNQQGLRFFLANTSQPVTTGISIEGHPQGRLHYRSMASLGGMISCQVDRKVSQISAIEILNNLICQLRNIDLSEESHTGLVLGSVTGGATYKIPARQAHLKFQLRSDNDQSVDKVAGQIDSIIDEAARQEGVSAHLEVIARTGAGGLSSSHALVAATRNIMSTLGIQPQQSIYSATVSGYVEHDIPAVCIGITNGDNVNYSDEYIEIEPILTGVTQLIGLLMCIDGGNCA